MTLLDTVEDLLLERPAGTVKEIVERVNEELGLTGLQACKRGDINQLLHWWRDPENAQRVGSTVQYVRAAPSGQRYQLALVDHEDGTIMYDRSQHEEFKEGQFTNLRRIGSYANRAALMTSALIDAMETPLAKSIIRGLAEEYIALKNKTRTVLEQLQMAL
jgi:hypothetical protein